MAVVINGNGTVTGISVGGLPDGIVDSGTLATNSVDSAELIDGAVDDSHMASISGRKNILINGNFDVWQRGTSFSDPSGETFTADRFFAVSGGATTGDTISRQAFTTGQTDVPNNPTYFLRFSVGSTSSNRVMQYRIEDVRTGAGQTYTLSFWGKASTTHSSTIEIQQNFGSGGSTPVTQSPVNYSLTTSWQKFTFNITMPSISGKTIGTSSYVYIAFIRSLPASSVDIDIAQMQFEKGSVATDFEHRSFGEELALCQRYYEKSFNDDVAPANGSSSTTTASNDGMSAGLGSNNSGIGGSVDYKVTKRSNPTITKYGNNAGGWYYTPPTNQASGSWSTNSGYIDHSGVNGFNFKQNIAGDTLYIMFGHWTADAEL